MKTLLSTLILASTAAFAAAATQPNAVQLQEANAPMLDAPVLAGQFNAVLHSRSGQWQLIDPAGTRLQFQAEGCPSNPFLPTGLWLLTRDGEQQPELIALSATALPDGHSGHIQIRPCGSAQTGRAAGAELQLPQVWITTLEQHGSAILITD